MVIQWANRSLDRDNYCDNRFDYLNPVVIHGVNQPSSAILELGWLLANNIWLRKVHLYLRRDFEKPYVALEKDSGRIRYPVLHKRHPGP